MPSHPHRTALLQTHFCVLLWGFTAIFGKLITLPALPLVWWRMLIVVAVLALLPRVWRGLRAMPTRHLRAYAGIGALVGLHWLTFYASIKLANASVGATCMALATAFIAVVEPWLARRPFSWRELLLGVALLPGVALVVGGVPHDMRAGVAVGALSAFFVSIFASLNKRMAGRDDPLAVTGIELGAGVLLLTVLAPLVPHVFPALANHAFVLPETRDALYLLALALLCTLLPFTLSLVALRRLSAYTVQLAINLEPVYAIVLAILLLGEQRELTGLFYAGVAIILSAVFLQPLLQRPKEMRHAEMLGTSESKNVAE
ncbi:MAG: DMT family transporter [Pseudoxanthomonas sp.]